MQKWKKQVKPLVMIGMTRMVGIVHDRDVGNRWMVRMLETVGWSALLMIGMLATVGRSGCWHPLEASNDIPVKQFIMINNQLIRRK